MHNAIIFYININYLVLNIGFGVNGIILRGEVKMKKNKYCPSCGVEMVKDLTIIGGIYYYYCKSCNYVEETEK